MLTTPHHFKMTRTLLAAAALFAAGSVLAADAVRYLPVPNSSKVRIDGTSTIHDWHAESEIIGGSMEFDATFADGKSSPTSVKPKVEVRIPVRSLKSSGGNKMDVVMLEHMKYASHKIISYQVIELTPKAGASGQFEAKGTLTIAGVTLTNTMPVTIERVENTKLKVTGTTALKMTDFGIKPPAPEILGMSLIRTGDEVKLKFEWVTAPKSP